MDSIRIRNWNRSDDVTPITALLHEAYASLAARGFRYMATHQDDTVTLRRLSSGTSFLAFDEDKLVGCVSVYPPKADTEVPYYRQPGVYRFGQFAVRPAWQKRGIGRTLFQICENEALANGATEIACDTAEGATDLIALYTRWGFALVDHVSWPDTNYRSVILTKSLGKLAD